MGRGKLCTERTSSSAFRYPYLKVTRSPKQKSRQIEEKMKSHGILKEEKESEQDYIHE